MARYSSRGRSFVLAAFLIPVAGVAQATPDWSTNYKNGVAAFSSGHYKDAISLLAAAAEQARTLNQSDINLAQISHALAMSYQFNGDPGHAEPLYLQAKSIFESLGPGARGQLATTLTGLGLVRVEQEKWQEAEELFTRALDLCPANKTPDRCSLTAMRHLGDLFAAQGRPDDAVKVLEPAVRTARETTGLDAGLRDALLRSLGYAYMLNSSYSRAEPLLRESLESASKNGDQDLAYADSLMSLGRLYRLRHDAARAAPLVKKARAAYEAAGDPLMSTAWSELGIIAIDQGKYTTARDLFNLALEFNRRTFGPAHVTVARAEFNLAQAYMGERKYLEAKSHVEAALAGQRKLFGETHPDVAKSYMLAAEVEASLHHPDQADEHYRAALAIFRVTSPGTKADLASAEQEYRQFGKSFAK